MTQKKSTQPEHSAMHKVLTVIIVAVNIVVAILLMTSAWAGYVNPADFPLLGVAPMLTPIAVVLMLIMLIVDIIAWRRTALFAAFVMLITLPCVLDVMPLHVSPHKLTAAERERSWTLLSMNVLDFFDITGKYPGDVNPALEYILRTDADVVCLQETEYFSPFDEVHITQAQMDSVTTRYPYVLLKDNLLLLSKYKADPIYLDFSNYSFGYGSVVAYRLHIDDRPVTLFNLHLHSFLLNEKERQILRDWRHHGSEKFSEAYNTVIDKLTDAAVGRAQQVDRLVELVKHYGGTNVVVCGDFNDVSGCYAMRQLEAQHLRDVHASVGFGYVNTFYNNRFYFCIDHIMWRGDMTATTFNRDKVEISDHYPIRTTFTWKE